MLDTIEEKRAFLASSELSWDPLYQKSMDTMYHHWMQDKWKKEGEWYLDKIRTLSNNRTQ